MELYRALHNWKLEAMDQSFSEDAWHAFHQGDINNQDDFYDYFHEWIDNACIYTSDCEAILEGNSEYHYDDHDLYGRPENISQAAYGCLYDYLMDSPDTVTWEQMEHVLHETDTKIK
jgi:hypothetical protein